MARAPPLATALSVDYEARCREGKMGERNTAVKMSASLLVGIFQFDSNLNWWKVGWLARTSTTANQPLYFSGIF